MGKNKGQQAKKRQAKALKRRTKSKKARGQRVQAAQLARRQHKAAVLEMQREIKAFKEDPKGFGFWACHGINYIASDLEEGLWDPPFPEIYEGQQPSPDKVEKYIYSMIDPENPKFTKVGRTLMGYWFSGEDGMYALMKVATKRAEEAGEDPMGAAQASVWGVFSEVHERVGSEMGNKHLMETEIQEPASEAV